MTEAVSLQISARYKFLDWHFSAMLSATTLSGRSFLNASMTSPTTWLHISQVITEAVLTVQAEKDINSQVTTMVAVGAVVQHGR